ncbi:hypothetical protein LAB1_50540 [Roseibium sp. LAB1]
MSFTGSKPGTEEQIAIASGPVPEIQAINAKVGAAARPSQLSA